MVERAGGEGRIAWAGRKERRNVRKAEFAGGKKQKQTPRLVDTITKPCLSFGPNKRTDI